jgi:hypothetical protein
VDNLFENGIEYPYVLTVDCSVAEEEEEEERTCEVQPTQLGCGSVVVDQLGYVGLNNESMPSFDPDATFHIYQVNITDMEFWNVSVYAHTCSEQTTFDTYLSLFPTCPTLSDDVSAIAANDDMESQTCDLTDAGASQMPFMVLNNTNYGDGSGGALFLMVERYAFGSDLVFDPGFNYTYELEIVCEAPEEPEPECPATFMQCGECVSGFLGYGYDNSTNATTPLSTTPVESMMYVLNISEAFYNTTITATTCLAGSNFDTALSLFDMCPATSGLDAYAYDGLMGNGSITLLASNDDDEECYLSDAGASTFEYTITDPGNFFLSVERSRVLDAVGAVAFERDTSYDYELCVICEVDEFEEPEPDEPFSCPVQELQCGETVYGYLGWNVTNNASLAGGGYYSLDEAVSHHLYRVNLTENLYNLTISASTCSQETNFDTYVTLFSDCPHLTTTLKPAFKRASVLLISGGMSLQEEITSLRLSSTARESTWSGVQVVITTMNSRWSAVS